MSHTDTTVPFKVNAPQVLHEAFDDETVVINLDSGAYYTLNDVAQIIWDILANGGSIDGATADALARYSGDKAEIGKSVRAFAGQLQAEELIVADHKADAAGEPTVTPRDDENRQPFSEPVLQKYTDMQELLLLDPIHEVDEHGWPTAKKAK